DAEDEPRRWPVCARLMPHISPLESHVERTPESNKALDALLYKAGLYLRLRGDLAGAMVMAEKSVAIAEVTKADDPLNFAIALGALAGRYADFDLLDEAE